MINIKKLNKSYLILILLLFLPWLNFTNSSDFPALPLGEDSVGFYQINTCSFNLQEILFKTSNYSNIEIRHDLNSSVECHGKLNGFDKVGDKLIIYIGTNLNIDLIYQSIIWLFCIYLLPKSNEKYKFKYKKITVSLITLISYLHLYGESSFYIYFSENFSLNLNLNNYFLMSYLFSIALITSTLMDLISIRTKSLIEALPFSFLIIGTFNSLNLSFILLIFLIFGLDAIFEKRYNGNFSYIYLFFSVVILFKLNNKIDSTFLFDVDKLKGFVNSTNNFYSTFYWIIIYYLIVIGFNNLIHISGQKINILSIRKNFIISGSLLTIMGIVSAKSPVVNFLTYYYLGLNKYGMNTFSSVSGNTWRGISPSAEALGEFYAYIVLLCVIFLISKKIKFSKLEIINLFIIAYGFYRTNNIAAVSSLLFLIVFFLFSNKFQFKKIKSSLLVLLSFVLILITLLNTTPYSTKYLSKAILYHGIANSELKYELPKNEAGKTAIESMSFGEILLYEKEDRSLSTSLYNMLLIYNDDRDIKNVPNVVSVVSAISVPINRSEKWGIFIAKYNPSTLDFMFGLGPNQLADYYTKHKSKVNTGLILPHSSLLDYLIFFGIFGVIVILILIIKNLSQNRTNEIFVYLLSFLLINLLKSDSLLYFNYFLLFMFTFNIHKLKITANE